MFDRVHSFLNRVKTFQKISTGIFAAPSIVFKIKMDKLQKIEGSYRGRKFVFRGVDEQAVREVFSLNEYGFVEKTIRGIANPSIIDMGAHIGTFAMWSFSVNKNCLVLSVEANPVTFEILQENSRRFSRDSYNWKIVNKAGYGIDGEVLKFSNSGPTMSNRVDNEGEIEVESLSLKSTLELAEKGEGGKIDLLKIDIEGAEQEFLSATPGDLKKVRNLLVEFHPYLINIDQVLGELRNIYKYEISSDDRISNKPLILFSNEQI
jgi:FkbM family methyltransferase